MITIWTTPSRALLGQLPRTRLTSPSTTHLVRKRMTTVLAVPASHGQAKNHRSPRQIIDSLDGATDEAHKSGDLLLFDSTMSSVEEDGVQVRPERASAAQDRQNCIAPPYFFLLPNSSTDLTSLSTNYEFALRFVPNLGLLPQTLHQMGDTSWPKRSPRTLFCLHLIHCTSEKSSMNQRSRSISSWYVS